MWGMDTMNENPISREEATKLSLKATQVFQPQTPISAREFFAGRWEQITTVADAVSQIGLHIVLFGERGVGKTSLANIIGPLLSVLEEDLDDREPESRLVVKVNTHEGDSFSSIWLKSFEEVYWFENKPAMGFGIEGISERISLVDKLKISSEPLINEVRKVLSICKRSVFIFDEFDRGSDKLKKTFTDLIKTLSDYAVDTTIVLVGVSDTVDDLVRDHASITRSIIQIRLPRMSEKELKKILEKAAKVLGIYFIEDAASFIVRMSQGLPHYTHLIGLHSTRKAANRLSRQVGLEDVHSSFVKAVSQVIQSIQSKFLQAVHSAHKEALYGKVIVACAAAASRARDAIGYFHPSDVVGPLSEILDRPNVTIATFQKHINEFCEEDRGLVLERDGSPRAYKYRFRDPLLLPFIFMNALNEGLVTSEQLKTLTSMR